MKKTVFLLFICFSFVLAACNTKSFSAAYQKYNEYQQEYIKALLNGDKRKEIEALKNLIQCGKLIHFDVDTYQKTLKTLEKSVSKKPHLKKSAKNDENSKKIQSPKRVVYSKYIVIHNTDPLRITIPNPHVFYFTLKDGKYYKKVIDLKDAITPKFVKRTIGRITLRIAQFNKRIVRIVYSSKKPFYLKYYVKNHVLYVNLHKQYTITKRKSTAKPVVFRKRKIIVIDPGHGGKDPGGIGLNHALEKVAVLEIAKKVKKYLQQMGFIVYLTRSTDRFIPLEQRTHFANEKHANLFISIHCNIAPHHIKYPNGIQIYYLSPTEDKRALQVARLENKGIKGLNYLDQNVILNFLNSDRIVQSEKLGMDIMHMVMDDVRPKFYLKNGGVRPAPFWVLVGTQMPAVLIETGYLTNPLDERHLFNPQFQNLLAKGIAQGVKLYFEKNP
jgi:N-acetylmuramoyl-L-alanine amidase